MIVEEFKLPLMDFVERADEIPNLLSVVLFGSVVKGDVSKKSDIDILLLFDADHNPELGKEAEIARKIASEISVKHDLKHPFSLHSLTRGVLRIWTLISSGTWCVKVS